MRKKWGGEGGVGEDKAEDFLRSRGYVLRRDWLWEHPRVLEWKDMRLDEQEAMCFLCDEWDYGGLYHHSGLD